MRKKLRIINVTGAFVIACGLLINPVKAQNDDVIKGGLTSLPEPICVSDYEWDEESEYSIFEYLIDEHDQIDEVSAIKSNVTAEYWGKYASWYYYNKMSDKQKKIWDAYYSIAMEVFDINEDMDKTSYAVFKASDGITKDELTFVRNIFFYANPQFYFMDGTIRYSLSNGKVTRVSLGIASDFQNATVRQSATAAFKAKLDAWVALVKQGKYDEDKEKIAHDIIASNTIYKLSAANSQSAYSLVVNGQTVCAGYAGTMQLLLNAAGVETIEVTSDSHGWNMVKLHDKWYVVDVTWDDRDGSGNSYDYQYYNKSIDTILKNDSDKSHIRQNWYDDYLPEAVFDSQSTSRNHMNAYFTEDGYTYFIVNSNTSLGRRIAKVIEAPEDKKLWNAPRDVEFDEDEYEVDKPTEESAENNTGNNNSNTGNGSDNSNTGYTGWKSENGKDYWYENDVKQGVKYNADGSIDLSYRGKEIYDPGTDAWYWLDNVQGGAKTTSKDVFQESEAGVCAADSKTGTGKWVRYDSEGHMVKGFDYVGKDMFYFDEVYGTMVKGYYSVEGVECYFNKDTGVLESIFFFPYYDGWNLSKNGYYYWFENYQRQGYSIDPNYRGKEIFDPDSNAWYWLDNVLDGAKAVSKDVYQESEAGEWGDKVGADGKKYGKWVRYDADGLMIKGWCAGSGANATPISSLSEAGTRDIYYFDPVYGTMAKGVAVIDGRSYVFDTATGKLK